MADVNGLWARMNERLSFDELKDIFNRLNNEYDFKNYVKNDLEVTKVTCRICELEFGFKIERVIFNPPATIIIWTDGTKSVVKCQNNEPYDAEKGFALAYLKKLLGNDNTFNKEINKWVKYTPPTEPTEVVEKPKDDMRFKTGDYAKIIKCLNGHEFEIGTVVRLEKSDIDYLATDEETCVSWWVTDEELKPVKGKRRK